MNNVVRILLSLSLSGSILAIALAVLRPLLKNRVSKAFQYYIWLLVLLRLVLPMTVDASVMNQLFSHTTPTHTTSAAVSSHSAGDTSAVGQNNTQSAHVVNTASSEQALFKTDETASANPFRSEPLDAWPFASEYLVILWLLGAAFHFSRSLIAYLRFTRSIRKTCLSPAPSDMALFYSLGGNKRVSLVCSPHIETPMLIGLVAPCIVIPQAVFVDDGKHNELRHILSHELTHYRRKDLLYKWLVLLVCSVHWFNPLMIWVRREINRTCELSCDEAVIQNMSDETQRRDYGETLLAVAAGKSPAFGVITTTMCEEKHELKERLMSIMNYKKKTAFTIAISLILMLILVGCSVALGAANADVEGRQTDAVLNTGAAEEPADIPSATSASGSEEPASAQPPAKTMSDPAESFVSAEDFNEFSNKDYTGDPYTLLKVMLPDGGYAEKTYPGMWISHVSTGDLSGDGQADIVLYLEHLGSSQYGDGNAYVLHIEDNQLAEYPNGLIRNPDIKMQLPKNFGADVNVLVGAEVAQIDGRNLLRIIEQLMDAPEDTIRFIDAAFSKEGWQIEAVKTLSGEEYLQSRK